MLSEIYYEVDEFNKLYLEKLRVMPRISIGLQLKKSASFTTTSLEIFF